MLLHTGQHYDHNMSQVFFDELEIPEPDYNLDVGSGTHATQTGRMLAGIEQVLFYEKPDAVLVYGDTNSTLAGALAAVKLHIPVAHVEAGLRSFNNAIPEEINRILTDRISFRLFCPTRTAAANLKREGITAGVHITGDVMYDALTSNLMRAEAISPILQRLQLRPKEYILVTVHRPSNTDDPIVLKNLCLALRAIAGSGERVIFPAHPRTLARLEAMGETKTIEDLLVPPASYLEILLLQKNSKIVMTDSGGVQKEAFWLSVPCVTLREETEWVETVESGWNVLAGNDTQQIQKAVDKFLASSPKYLPPNEDGHASERISDILRKNMNIIERSHAGVEPELVSHI